MGYFDISKRNGINLDLSLLFINFYFHVCKNCGNIGLRIINLDICFVFKNKFDKNVIEIEVNKLTEEQKLHKDFIERMIEEGFMILPIFSDSGEIKFINDKDKVVSISYQSTVSIMLEDKFEEFKKDKLINN